MYFRRLNRSVLILFCLLLAALVLGGCGWLFGSSDVPDATATPGERRALVPTFTSTPETPVASAPPPVQAPPVSIVVAAPPTITKL